MRVAEKEEDALSDCTERGETGDGDEKPCQVQSRCLRIRGVGTGASAEQPAQRGYRCGGPGGDVRADVGLLGVSPSDGDG